LFANDPLVVLDHVHSGVEERLLAVGRGPGGRMMFPERGEGASGGAEDTVYAVYPRGDRAGDRAG